tara:strand:- start:738 stop:845 length:108 start_codon:yes stop_codon:yes gene_type:complete
LQVAVEEEQIVEAVVVLVVLEQALLYPFPLAQFTP